MARVHSDPRGEFSVTLFSPPRPAVGRSHPFGRWQGQTQRIACLLGERLIARPRRLNRRRSVPPSRKSLENTLDESWHRTCEWAAAGGRVVAQARDRATGESVCISAVFCDDDGMATARMAREIGVLETLTHQPAVVPLLGSGRVDGWLYMVTPWREMSLREHLVRVGPLDVEVALEHAIAVADLLHLTHSLGLTHGAVSADALFVEGGQVQLGAWTSASRIRTENDRPRAATRDVFGLGNALYELLSGTKWAPNSRMPDQLPDVLTQFLHRALGPDRDARYATAIAFAQALCIVREALSDDARAVSGRDATSELLVEELPLSDGVERSLRVLHALLDRAEVADQAPERDDPLVVECWHRADAQVASDDARLVALRCRWQLLAERDPVGALHASQQAPHAAAVLPYRARALAALGRASEARTVAVRSWFDDVALDLSGVRSLVIALLLTRAFEMASLVSVSEFAAGVTDPVILAAGQSAVARGTVPRLTPAAQTRTLRAISSALDRRVPWTAELLVDPRWDALRADHRFAVLLARSKAAWTT